jgi:preprotein translocase subunit YajC
MNFYDLIAMSGSPEGQGSGLGGMVPFILIIVVIYFFMIRPQSKKAKQHQQLLSALKKGDKVVTIGGIHGTVVEVREKTFLVKVSPNTDIEFIKSSVAEVVQDQQEIKKV